MASPVDREPRHSVPAGMVPAGMVPAGIAVGPRFDVRFEPEGGLLELAKPLRIAAVEIESLSLALGRVRFPLAVGGGAVRFRTRRTTARRARMRIDLRALAALCAERGVQLRFAGVTRDGALRCVLVDAAGALAFEATPLADGADVAFALRAARAATDGPAPALARVLAALRPLGATLDGESGLLRLRRPLRLVLREALASHGWRVPDERGVRLAAPQLDDRSLTLATASDGASETLSGAPAPSASEDRQTPAQHEARERPHAESDGSAARDLGLREDARLLAPVMVALEASDTDAARARIERLVARGDASAVRPALRELAAALSVDVGDPRAGFEVASLSVAEDDVVAASLAASLSLRLALRAGDADAAASAARRVDACESAGELAAAALQAAARALDATRIVVRAELLTRAAARSPSDAQLAAEAVAASVAAGDLHAAERTARRALTEIAEPAARVSVVRAAASELASDAAALALAPLWDEGLALAADDPLLLVAASRAHLASGDTLSALTLIDRAASASLALGEPRLAAAQLARAAMLATALGRDDGAAERLANAAALDPEDGGAILAALAATQERIGAMDDAAAVYARLLARGPGRAQSDALVAAIRLHLARTEPREARAFLEAARRVAPLHSALPELSAAVDAAIADGWTSSPGSLCAIDVFALAGVARDASDPGAVVRAVSDALRAGAPAGELPALVAAGRLAVDRLAPADAAQLRATLADLVAAVSEHIVDESDLAALEPHASTDEARAVLAGRSAQLLRGAGQGGPAARALARAGVVRRDAATLRAAIDLAMRAEAWDDAASIVQEALEVVGDGPARAQLIARAATIAEKRRP